MGPTETFSAHGKVILLGEHAVLRGNSALVFPLKSQILRLITHRGASRSISIQDNLPDGVSAVFESLLEEALQLTHRSFTGCPEGHFALCGNLLPGQGLGFSAALCLLVAKWVYAQQLTSKQAIIQLAHQLEQRFHGKSSGIDIIGTLEHEPQYFETPQCYQVLSFAWKPKLYLELSEHISRTIDAVSQVSALFERNECAARLIDKNMQEAVLLALRALNGSHDSIQATTRLTAALNKGYTCFKDWHLIPNSLTVRIDHLKSKGALAVKPTGAGGNGALLSLWRDTPPSDLNLIPIEY